ncbi:MAG: OstA-like protein [Bacteroidales bacterium]
MAYRQRIIGVLVLLIGCQLAFAQQKSAEDSLFRLLDARSAQQLDENGMEYRRVVGSARFLHNNTYLLCDSASWNVGGRFVEAFGNVRIIQDRTMLSSEKMLYLIDQNKAIFSGGVVELTDKERNTLRTSDLDYNTKDSIATFKYGGAMKDKSGNVIESKTGVYDSKQKTFTFEEDVEMYNDSTFINSTSLRYFTDQDKAYLGKKTYMWRGAGFLVADAGWYDKKNDVINLSDNVYMNDPDYEAWADEVYYFKQQAKIEMYHNVQILDTANKTILLGNKAEYGGKDSLKVNLAIMTNKPAVVYYGENENHEVDTLFICADTLLSFSIRQCDFSKEEIQEAETRKSDILFDALEELRTKQAEERKKQAYEKMKEAGRIPPEIPAKDSVSAAKDSLGTTRDSSVALKDIPVQTDSTLLTIDSLARSMSDSLGSLIDTVPIIKDSLWLADSVAMADSIAFANRDTTLVRHLIGYRNVKLFRSDLQAACDSLVFTELDSIIRMYGGPILWNQIKNQLTSETMQLLTRDNEIHRGSMLNDAMITTREDSIHFNQIKSTEMMGFFRNNQLYRYDALGGVTAIYYMVEDEQITNVNIKEAKSLTAVMKNANPQKMLYMDAVKSDAYPLASIKIEKQRLKGFVWRGDERPVDRFVITDRAMKVSQRDKYAFVMKPTYFITNRYFDNYMKNVCDSIEIQRQRRREAQLDSVKMEAHEEFLEANKSGSNKSDSLAAVDSLAAIDSVVVAKDSLLIVKDQDKGKDLNEAVDAEQDRAVAQESAVVKKTGKKLTCKEKRALRREKRALRKKKKAETLSDPGQI